MQFIPHLPFNGQCEEAFKFYEQCFGGKIGGMMTYGTSPMADQMPPEWHDKVMHVYLAVGDQEIMGADSMPGYFEEAKGLAVVINIDDPSKAEQTFQTLAAEGTIRMPIQETFWASRFGMLVDKYGIPWMINCGQAA